MLEPFGSLVLVEKLDTKAEVKKLTGIYVPDTHQGRFWKIKVLRVGKDVSKEIAEGDICITNPIPEVDDESILGSPNTYLMHQSQFLGRVNE